MPRGPGKYDEECTIIRVTCEADGVVLIVLGGNKGSGFSCQIPATDINDSCGHLVRLLREMADQIEKDITP